ncbi:transcriptional regulator [Labrys miyagiensis]|uniref:Transcriptional regulator n=1 Tax=Labrys miyagiensis TaxID=346912 RepID=A0ABQ6CGY8_9HYPH|nr:MurR/RpiR family transcriptional regulator [Labrys miyagiensis]GLS19415.1 transcriptional regulator [Labrys miyagiensis]
MSVSPSFDERVAERLESMSPAEQRVVRYFQDNREEVLIASAAALAEKAETSDATVVRATKALGFAGLEELRRTLAAELRNSLSPAERLSRTLGEVGGSLPAAFETTLETQIQSLADLRRTITPELFQAAIEGMIGAKRVLVFGLGPSSAVADYLVFQLSRFGLEAAGLSNTGLLFADDLRRLRAGDFVVMLAYGRVYTELSALLDEIRRLRLGSLLLTDTLAAMLQHRVGIVLPVARGRADMLSLHTATLGLIETLLVGIASQRPAETLANLRALNEAREKLAGKAMDLPVSPEGGAKPRTP